MDVIEQFKTKFIEESTDNIREMEESLLLLESDMENKETIERIFRAMHSIKGGGAMFGFNRLSEFTHYLETIFDEVRNGKLSVTTELITLTFAAIDHINQLLKVGDNLDEKDSKKLKLFVKKLEVFMNNDEKNSDSNNNKSKKSGANDQNEGEKSYLITFIPKAELLENGTNPFFLLDDLHSIGNAITISYTDKIPSFENIKPDLCYVYWQLLISTKKTVNDIKDIFIFVEDNCELIIDHIADYSIIDNPDIKELVKKSIDYSTMLTVSELKKCITTVAVINKEEKKVETAEVPKEHKISSIRVSSNKIDELVTLVSELVIIQSQLTLYAENHNDTIITSISENIQKLSRQLRDNAFDISLIPLQSELMRFQRLVRDLSKEEGKDIDFIIEGSEIELDKTIIENLTDPLLHILRNSVDHGIETPEERIAAGKSPKGTILFKAYNSGAYVMIEISDDGKGIDPEVIRTQAVAKGLIDAEAKLEKDEIFNLLFISGFSTREVVSDISGRGVGMDVVRRKITGIRGDVSIDSEIGKGTMMSIRLPLTLSIIDGLLIRVMKNHYVIPVSAIETIYLAEKSKKDTTFNYVVTINDEQIPYIDLREIFQNPQREDDEYSQMILIKIDERKLGILCDQVIGEYQTVMKPLGRYLEKQGYISGASIMGDGTIALVIDTSRLFNARKIKKDFIHETKSLNA